MIRTCCCSAVFKQYRYRTVRQHALLRTSANTPLKRCVVVITPICKAVWAACLAHLLSEAVWASLPKAHTPTCLHIVDHLANLCKESKRFFTRPTSQSLTLRQAEHIRDTVLVLGVFGFQQPQSLTSCNGGCATGVWRASLQTQGLVAQVIRLCPLSAHIRVMTLKLESVVHYISSLVTKRQHTSVTFSFITIAPSPHLVYTMYTSRFTQCMQALSHLKQARHTAEQLPNEACQQET